MPDVSGAAFKNRTRAAGFLGRGPWFWLGMTCASTAALVGLALSDAIESKGTVFILFIVPLLSMVAMAVSLLRLNEAGSGNCVPKGIAQRRYIKRVAIFTSLYLATFAFMTFADEAFVVPLAGRVAIALLPGLAVSGVFWAIARLIIEEQDEFLRMLTIRQTLIASGFALSLASIWGFLESADLVVHLDAYWVAIAWFFGLLIGAGANFAQHGTMGVA
ncbi:MAG: hypothetical protein QNI87_07365 [Erythrobacter sp.]|uniref:hypothetical protein n=1 Tax=Erythrobacter sp. TaxID=1042 RepID=UPI002626CCAD|nr:hypothetical protein [Erythrobacter sp.]MDJ0978339.1 hypothetical protein [Erythrobacter sp.]